MNELERYALALLTEECGEVLQEIGKAGRFGIDTPFNPEGAFGVTPRRSLAKEVGDLLAAIYYADMRGVLNLDEIYEYKNRKLDKLMNPNSKDERRRRLAP